MTLSLTRRVVIAAALASAAPLALAQAFPSKPVRILVGYSAGGGVDALARLLAQSLSTSLGQQVIVENRAGAAGLIAAEVASTAPADGHTLLMGESGLLIAPHLKEKVTLDPLKAFTPVAGAFLAPLMIVANNDLPAGDPKAFIQLLKSNPGKYSYATSGVGTVHHLGFELMKNRTGAFAVHIPYRGAAQIVPDVMSNQVPIGVVSATAGMAQARAGKLKAIALMSKAKLPGAEDVPTLAEAIPEFDAAPRLMLLAPAGTPAAIVQQLSEATRNALARPEMTQALAKQGAIPAYMPPPELARDMARESAEWLKVIKAQKISAE
ncbi:tripartite tricarboxylate transporter substrate binding protein [Ramlibacter sp. AW1]|uniref:Tripartite tricarboxylate transporter substrate binding protein n=1 Tax=Ramlibacter aurantiacus TaxID=2801330 RepID=A0A936ZXU0_9BURK|nr:tripartite tricarboxylate transporter substrate binding protein [Ramlibacter aurantiacus]MBL0423060.1 tripartite tricarboxylate transporter substrate binding protein [Ramlibacter aurantiacus]